MNKAITDGVTLMPPAFAGGLSVWSRGDGTPGSDTYATDPNAAFVPADQDFGGCLEIQKSDSVQKLRYMGDTPLLPGCYLQIKARIKAVSGALPGVRIAGWAGQAGGAHATGLIEVGPTTTLTNFGDVVEVAAIVGTGQRGGVDMPWGLTPVYGHFGLDLTGPNGAIVRIDDIQIEDVTGFFLRDMLGVVDVQDFGAIGDGTTDNTAAFEAADTAANGRRIFVPSGTYRVNSNLTLNSEMEFEGTLSMPDPAILLLTKDYSLPVYIEAFGDEELALKKAFQALLNNVDHDSLDMRGRTVSVTAPIDMQAAVGNTTTLNTRRVIRNGHFYVEGSAPWTTGETTSQATYSTSNATQLTNVSNVANIEVGSLIIANGVGREVYVTSRNIGAQTLTLSGALHDAEGTQTYTFRRFRYVLDFIGFTKLSKMEIESVGIACNSTASGIMLAPTGSVFHLKDTIIESFEDRGITSCGTGCQGMLIDRCQFLSAEFGELAQNRKSISLNANSNDVKLRNNRSTRVRHFAVLRSGNNIITGNHFFQGDSAPNGTRTAGIILTQKAVNSTFVGNYVDNCFIEWTNESDSAPDFSSGFGFSGLSVTNNVFLCSGVAPWFTFIVLKPYGTGHFLNGFSVTGNMFRATQGNIDRVERVDTTFSNVDFTRMKKVDFSGNTFHNVSQRVENPVLVEHAQNSESNAWSVPCANLLPFQGRARRVESVVMRGPIQNGSNQTQYIAPYVDLEQGANGGDIRLNWGQSVRGDISALVRMDR